MAYEEVLTNFAAGQNGISEVVTNNLEPILFSQIFSGLPQLYAGSSFTVEELVEINTSIDDIQLLDVDFTWNPTKYYLGTWTLSDQPSVLGVYPENRGFLEDQITKVARYSTYVVQANADVPIAQHGQSAIDNCNFFLGEAGISVPPFSASVQILLQNTAVLKARDTLQCVPLQNQPFNQKIKSIALYHRPGSSPTSVVYKCRVINAISVNLPSFPLTVCDAVVPQNCTDLNTQYYSNLQLSNPGAPIFSTEADGVAYAVSQGLDPSQYAITDYSYTCTIAPGTVYPYWLFSLNQI